MAQIHPFSNFPSGFVAGVYEGDVLAELPFAAQKLIQVHGTQIVEVTQMGEDLEGDALMTQTPNVRLLIKTADCIPLVLADPTTGWVAGIHAGWRGLTADIVPKTLLRLQEKGVKFPNLQVGIGPSLGLECAEFSDPLAEIPEAYHWAIREDRHVDLWGILEKQLKDAGLDFEKVEWMRVCTACDPRWFSWRRDKAKGRFGTYIEIEGQV